ncbi:uncharacterized protein PHA67_007631 [Liasis olivaceus]
MEPACPGRGSRETSRAAAAAAAAAAADGGGGEGEGGRRSFTAASPVWSLRRDMHRPCPRPALLMGGSAVLASPPLGKNRSPPAPLAPYLGLSSLRLLARRLRESGARRPDEEKKLLQQILRGGGRPLGLGCVELLREAGVQAPCSLWKGCWSLFLG